METEAILTFIYKTVNAYSHFEDFIEQKLQSSYSQSNITNGYLIKWEYYDFWRRYSNYDQIKFKIRDKNYRDARQIIYDYRRKNTIRNYQADADQVVFYSAESLYDAVKGEKKAFVLIDEYFWKLICTERGLNEQGGMNYSLGKNTINFYFGQNEKCQIETYDNIIDETKRLFLPEKNNYRRKNEPEELELQKILLLYAFEQEMKNKINNLTYREKRFNNYYLISKEWILEYKRCYHYDEMSKMIRKKESLRKVLNQGYDYAKQNLGNIISKISVNKSAKKNFSDNLSNNNTFLCERDEVKFSDGSIISYWKDFEIVNEDLKNLLSTSELHGYAFENASDAKCLITSGKVIIDLSNDDYNENKCACEIGIVSNMDMLYNDEYIFKYEDEEGKNEILNFLRNNDFLEFQKENIDLGINLECELVKDGYAYGSAFKIPPHD